MLWLSEYVQNMFKIRHLFMFILTCSAVKIGSSLMQETMIACMSICSLSSSSSDRSKDWLSNFCPDKWWRREIICLYYTFCLLLKQHCLQDWGTPKTTAIACVCVSVAEAPHGQLGSGQASAVSACAMSSSPLASHCHSYPSRHSKLWGAKIRYWGFN